MARAFEFPRPTVADFACIRALLSAHGLPVAYLSLPMLAHFRVSREGDRIIAVAGLEQIGASGLLRSVAVDPAYRRRGLAARLVATLEAEASRLGITTLYLLTTSAAPYFAGIGYSLLERSHVPPGVRDSAEFSKLCPASAVCMTKRLGAAST